MQTIPIWFVKSSILFFAAFPTCTLAQIVPDATLPTNSSVNTEGSNTIIIEGTKAGSNLFHSFEQFSVPTGATAYFNNALDIQNIFSRVTGTSISNIDGLLRANGTANLFLLNPNGIIFGSNARLNIGGSFLASTASSLNFADNTQFSATSPQTTPLLTVSVPIGLGFGSNSGRIIVQGSGAVRDSSSGLVSNREAGLTVQPSKTLALVGNGVSLEGGILTTNGGRIEVGSVAAPSSVALTPVNNGVTLNYSGVKNFEDIQLSQQAAVETIGVTGGDIQVRGKQLTIIDGSQIESSILGEGLGGTLKIISSDSVKLAGVTPDGLFPSGIATTTQRGATGRGGNLTIETGQLSLRDGAQIRASTLGIGAAGDLVIKANDSVELIGTTPNAQFSTTLSTIVPRGATGRGGNLTIETGQLSLRDGAQIRASTLGIGAAGDLVIKANDSVELIGTTPNAQFPTTLSATTQQGATGRGGNLTIETGQLSLRDGAQIQAATFNTQAAGDLTIKASDSVELAGTTADGRFPTAIGTSVQRGATGNGGNLNIETGQLIIRDGAQIGSATAGTGAAGTLTVKAKDLVELIGTAPGSLRPSALSARTTSSGNAGNLRIETNRLSIRDGGTVTVSSEGLGRAGQLEVQAGSAILDNQAKLVAETFSGEDGNIVLQVKNSLQMRRNSQISATSVNAGNGGNIRINTGTLAALENSDIFANAISGVGGNIEITAQGIFGIEPRSELTPESDITADSEIGIDGEIEITTLDFDARNTLTPFTSNFVSTEEVIAGSCITRRNAQQGTFVVTGSGGYPITPSSGINEWEALTEVEITSSNNTQVEPRTLPKLNQINSTSSIPWRLGDPIVEAQAAVITSQDEALLVANVPDIIKTPSPESFTCPK